MYENIFGIKLFLQVASASSKLQMKIENMKLMQKDQFYKWMQKQALRNSETPKSFVNSVSKMAAARAGMKHSHIRKCSKTSSLYILSFLLFPSFLFVLGYFFF